MAAVNVINLPGAEVDDFASLPEGTPYVRGGAVYLKLANFDASGNPKDSIRLRGPSGESAAAGIQNGGAPVFAAPGSVLDLSA